jgi:hypothetical protein
VDNLVHKNIHFVVCDGQALTMNTQVNVVTGFFLREDCMQDFQASSTLTIVSASNKHVFPVHFSPTIR